MPWILGTSLLLLGAEPRLCAGHDAVGQPAFRVVPPGESLGGKTYSEWLAGWWQWALAIPWDGHHPLQDRTGADALRNQAGPVWFLGAGPNSSPAATRRIIIPEGQPLYVAIGNVECSTLERDPFHGADEAELRACADGHQIQETVCEVDGTPVADLEGFQVTSPVYSFVLPARNMLGIGGGGAGQSVASGVGVLLAQLAPGSHRIYLHSTYAEDPAHSLSQMSYEVTVVVRPTLSVRPLPGTGRVEISWPETAGFALRQADAMDSPPTWSAAPVDSSTVKDGVRSVTLATGPTQRYFRLEFR